MKQLAGSQKLAAAGVLPTLCYSHWGLGSLALRGCLLSWLTGRAKLALQEKFACCRECTGRVLVGLWPLNNRDHWFLFLSFFLYASHFKLEII